MPFNTLSVATAVTPSVIETYISHYLNRGPLRQKPTAHISYHEGLRLIRRFLDYSSQHSVEDLQAFTAQWVPAPTWVRTVDSEIAPQFLERAARLVQQQLGRRGLEKIGGKTWWQWRRPESPPLKAEWIEMKKDFNERKRLGTKVERVILYVHGGAYYFGSVDEHRYQMQRHARKLKARILAPRYRLAPQFPFPCGLYDCIATYLYLLQHFRPEQILFGGDSAGGGMVLSMLVVLRDQGCPLPAGTILLSPWVDLTHSFPSVAGDGGSDYIPPHGFHHKPSMAWPPPPSDEVRAVRKTTEQPPADALEMPDTSVSVSDDTKKSQADKNKIPGFGNNLSIMLDGNEVEMKEQIQMYAPNDLLAHPLVSPVMQPSLGGLPPMLIQVGDGELLRDEQLYLAHKAANPKAYPPSDAVLDEYDPRREFLNQFPPTNVQLQLWEDLCHVPHTLSFTRPAKYMYRSVAQFGAWALAHAQHKGIDIQNDDAISIISEGPEEGEDANASSTDVRQKRTPTPSESTKKMSKEEEAAGAVGKAGDPLPPFKDHMIRQRVTRHGVIYPLPPPSEIACLALDPASIGQIKPGPVRKWLAKRKENDVRFANDKKKVQKRRAKELAAGYDVLPGEIPPPTALVGRRRKGVVPEEKKRGKSWGLAMWSGWGSHHDEQTLDRQEKVESRHASVAGDRTVDPGADNAPPSRAGSSLTVPFGAGAGNLRSGRRVSGASSLASPWTQHERPRSPYRQVNDTGQANASASTPQLSAPNGLMSRRRGSSESTGLFPSRPVSALVPTTSAISPDSEKIPGSQNTYLDPSHSRPHNGVMAYPFKLRSPAMQSNLSTATLDSQPMSGASSVAGSGPVEMPAPEVEMPTTANTQQPQELDAQFVENSSGRANGLERVAVSPSSTTEARSAYPNHAGFVSPITLSDEHLVSPLDGLFSSPSAHQDPVFSNRTSLFGAVGADGMPIMPLLGSVSTYESHTSTDDARAALESVPPVPPLPPQDDLPAVSPIDEPKGGIPSPFKVRNPVNLHPTNGLVDQPRPDSVTVAPPAFAPAQPQDGGANETTTSAPFKLRNTAHVHPDSSSSRPFTPPHSDNERPRSRQTSAEEVANRAMTSLEQPSTENLPPNSNIVMPTVVPRRPTPSSPPQPTPRSERRVPLSRPSHGELKEKMLDRGAGGSLMGSSDRNVL